MFFEIFLWTVLPVVVGLACFAYVAYEPRSMKSGE